MKREIKFRAWDGKEMHEDVHEWGEGGYWRAFRLECFGDLLTSNHPVMQYTGLKDKNDVEIYEGDVVRIHNLTENWKRGEPDFDWRVFKIIYNRFVWAFENPVMYMPMSTYKDRGGEFYDYDIEVIGNIYENPELIA